MSIATGLRRYGMAATGVLLAAWSLTSPAFRDGEHFLTARIGLPLALAAAALILAVTAGTRWKAAGMWLALLIGGQAAALQLVQPTRNVGYQHYKTVADMATAGDIACLLLIALQAGAVLLALGPALGRITAWLREALGTWQTGAIVLLAMVTAAAPSLDLVNYGIEVLLAGMIQLVSVLTVVQLVRSIPVPALHTLQARLQSILPPADGLPDPPQPGGIDRFALTAALCVTAVAILLNLYVYQQHPHIPDEVVYLMHAGYLAKGMLALPLPPVADAFNIDLMIYEPDRWYSAFPPGWPAMLAVGSLLGAPWLVNPLLAGLCVLLAYLLARELWSRATARLVVILLCVSPWFVFLAMSYMAHIFTLCCVLAGALAVARMRRDGGIGRAVLAGAMIGITSMIRPLDGLAVAAALGLWSLGVRTWRERLTLVPLMVAVSILVGALTLPYNAYLTGDPGTFPVMAYFDRYYGPGVNALGFGADRGLDWRGLDPFPGHGLPDVVLNNYLNTFAVNIELFGWASGSLLLVFVLLFSGAIRRGDYRMVLVIGVIAGLHSLYWFAGGPDFGARYWFLILLPVIALSVRGMQVIGARLPDRDSGPTRVLVGILALSLAAAVNFFPWRSIDKYFHYNGMRPDMRILLKDIDFENSLVLVRGKRFQDYMSAAVYNDTVPQDGTTVIAWDRDGEVQRRLLEAFPNRAVWRVDGPTVTGAGFRVVEGPLDARELLERASSGQPAGAP